MVDKDIYLKSTLARKICNFTEGFVFKSAETSCTITCVLQQLFQKCNSKFLEELHRKQQQQKKEVVQHSFHMVNLFTIQLYTIECSTVLTAICNSHSH